MPPTSQGDITIEKTPRYFHDFVMPEVPSRISLVSKDINVIIVVRTLSLGLYARLKLGPKCHRNIFLLT